MCILHMQTSRGRSKGLLAILSRGEKVILKADAELSLNAKHRNLSPKKGATTRDDKYLTASSVFFSIRVYRCLY